MTTRDSLDDAQGRARQEMVDLLMRQGLSAYEARAYLALVMRSSGTADDVAEASGVPRTSAYKALDALKAKAYVTMGQGRPAMYYPVPPREVRDRAVAELDRTFERLEAVRGIMSDRGSPQLIYTIAGRSKVLDKAGEMLDSAATSVLVSAPSPAMLLRPHSAKIAKARERGVEFTIVAEPSAKVMEGAEVVRKTDLFAIELIADGDKAMIASPDLSMCGFSDDPFLVGYLEHFFWSVLDKQN